MDDAERPRERDGETEERATRRRPPSTSAEDRHRGRRMLGVLTATLAAAQEPTRRAPPASADVLMASRTDGPDARAPQRDVSAERRVHDAEREAARRDVARVRELAEKIAAHDLAHRTARAHQRRLSSFLVTHVAQARAPRESRMAAGGAPTYDLYYLPRQLVPAQDDMLDAQEDRADDAIDAADDEWDRERAVMHDELQRLQARLAEHHVAW